MSWWRERQINSLEKKIYWADNPYHYKGLDLVGFRSYFENGGIRPNPDPGTGFIALNLEIALGYTNIEDPLAAHDRSCLAAFSSYIREGDEPLDVDNYDEGIYGRFFVSWDNVAQLFMTEAMFNNVHQTYQTVAKPTITWEAFTAKTTIIEPDQLDFRKKLLQFLKGKTRR
jgi:hypothetical protein